MIVRRVRKEIEAFTKSMGISAEVVREARRKREKAEVGELARTESTSPVAFSARTRSTRIFTLSIGPGKKSSHLGEKEKGRRTRAQEFMLLFMKMKRLNLMKR